MSKLLAAVLLLATGVTASATNITVEGFGSSREAAKQDAFRTAIENVCGTLVVSDREHVNGATTNDQIITHSSCNVEKYTVLEESTGRVKMTVEVQPNRVAQRLQSSGVNKHFVDQANLEAQITTAKIERQDTDKLFSEIFRDYPSNAFALKTKVTIFEKSIRLDYNIRWNTKFLDALKDVAKSFSTPVSRFDQHPGLPAKIQFETSGPSDMWRTSAMFYTHDVSKVQKFSNYFNGRLYLKVQVQTNNGRYLNYQCVTLAPSDFYSAYTNKPYHDKDGTDYQVKILPGDKSGSVGLPLAVPATEIYSVEAVVVTNCN